jgi:UPF0755 protein
VRAIKIIFIAGLAVLTAGAGVAFWFYQYAVTPVGGPVETVVVWVKPGQGFFETMGQLQAAGLVRKPERFRWLAYLQGYETRIRAGEYALSGALSPQAILETMVQGDTILHKVVIPEGATVAQIGDIVEKAGLVPKATFMAKAFDVSLAEALGVEGRSLEGYLFPETYFFPKGITAEQILRKMVAQFRRVFDDRWVSRAGEQGFTVHEVVTLASIVEKETGRPDERPRIASVFLNRLQKRMRLESDPTVIYGLENFDGNITRKDLKTDTPYNTYRIKGLPPGPISNPGKASLEAVLYPPSEPYLYFVSKNDGSHHFSKSFSEHRRMVRKYQLRRH